MKYWEKWCAIGASFTDDKCHFCKKKAYYRAFYWDGKPKSSRSVGCSCIKHLNSLVRRAWRLNKEDKVGYPLSGE